MRAMLCASLAVMVTACGSATAQQSRTPASAANGSAGSTGSGSGFVSPPPPNAKLTGMFTDDDCRSVKGSAEAVGAFRQACTAQNGEGCYELSLRYLCGAGVPRDPAQAAQLSEQACDLGSGPACGNGASIYMQPDGGSPTKAMELATKGCNLDNGISCGYVAMFYWQGIGVPADPPRAATLLDVQCKKANLMACANQAVLLYMGAPGVARDLARSKDLGEKSCAGHMPAGCNILAAALLEQGGDDNAERAKILLGDVCDHGGGAACDNLGQVYAHGAGKQQPDKVKAREAFKRACDMQNALGCTHLGELVSE